LVSWKDKVAESLARLRKKGAILKKIRNGREEITTTTTEIEKVTENTINNPIPTNWITLKEVNHFLIIHPDTSMVGTPIIILNGKVSSQMMVVM
jgi:hypothetical protein